MTEPIIQLHKQFKILLIGDYCTDEYQYGHVDRISPEAPIPIFRLEDKICKEGMVGNVRLNLVNLGCVVRVHHGNISKKTRLVDKKSNQQIVRIDDDVISKPLNADEIDVSGYDAIVISDYNKGFVSYKLIEHLRQKFDGPIFLDTKKPDLAEFQGVYVKINETEYEKAKSYNDDLIVTMGDKGARYKNVTYPATPVGVSDVTGAGDTFLAALTYEYLNTNNISEAIKFALKASSITVQHLGCYAPTLEEICALKVE